MVAAVIQRNGNSYLVKRRWKGREGRSESALRGLGDRTCLGRRVMWWVMVVVVEGMGHQGGREGSEGGAGAKLPCGDIVLLSGGRGQRRRRVSCVFSEILFTV